MECTINNCNMPLITVIISAYNTYQPYFVQAIDSILEQSYGNFELILVDDGLSDENRSFLASINDSRMRIIVNDENLGQSVSVNKAIRAAKGKYIARMDTDDISLPNRLWTQVAYMEDNPECVACGGLVETTDRNRVLPVSYPDMESRIIGLFFACDMIHPTMMIRRSALEEFGICYDEKQLYAQDYMIWIDLLKCGQLGLINDILLKYRIHGNQISSGKRDLQDDCAIRAQKKLYSACGFNIDNINFRLHNTLIKYNINYSIKTILQHVHGLKGQADRCFSQKTARRFKRELDFRAVKAGVREIANCGNVFNGLLLVILYGVRPANWKYYVARTRSARPKWNGSGRSEVQ